MTVYSLMNNGKEYFLNDKKKKLRKIMIGFMLVLEFIVYISIIVRSFATCFEIEDTWKSKAMVVHLSVYISI